MIKISCIGKLHSFNLAEQIANRNKLSTLYTSYAYQKNNFVRNFVRRVDKELISPNLIKTNILFGLSQKLIRNNYIINEYYDLWVKSQLKNDTNYKIFIGWSGMSLNSLREAKKKGKIVILERGSSHISFQNRILKDEYQLNNINFQIDPKVIIKEKKEYEEADFISIPSNFVRDTFIEEGVNEKRNAR